MVLLRKPSDRGSAEPVRLCYRKRIAPLPAHFGRSSRIIWIAVRPRQERAEGQQVAAARQHRPARPLSDLDLPPEWGRARAGPLPRPRSTGRHADRRADRYEKWPSSPSASVIRRRSMWPERATPRGELTLACRTSARRQVRLAPVGRSDRSTQRQAV